MNYEKIYNQIIKKAQQKVRDGYLEKHHIIPKCMGGTNDSSNLVLLTAREHFICHWLLAKQYRTKALWNAFAMMAVSSEKHIRNNSKHFERMRIARRYAMSGDGNPMFGKKSVCVKHTPETIEKIRLSKIGKKRNPFNRKPATQETKDKISLSNKNKPSKLKGRVLEKVECPHCHKMSSVNNYSRWHGDSCKMRV